MKIVSDFKDFYDVARAGDDEATPVYRRFTALHWLVPGEGRVVAPAAVSDAARELWRDDTVPPAVLRRWQPQDVPLERVVVGLCGRAYAFYVVGEEVRVGDAGKERAPVRGCGSHDAVVRAAADRVAFWKHHDAEKSRAWAEVFAQLAAPPRRRHGRAHAFDDHLGAESWQRFAARKSSDVPARLFVALQSPIVAHFDDRVVVSPRLADLGFQSQLPPQQVWQELSLFLGNTLVALSTPQPRPISDALRAETHGFDKDSFRKKKGGRSKLDRGEW